MDTKELLITAQLAQLALTDEDAGRLKEAVTQMLEYFSSMQEIDVTGLEPTTHALLCENRLRDDYPKDYEKPRLLISEAPETDGQFITVPRVL